MKVCKICGSTSTKSFTNGVIQCLRCGASSFEEIMIGKETKGVPIDCNHNVDVQFLNGEYISVCTICGKILDRKRWFK